MEKYALRDEVVETVNKLFVYTDSRNWDALRYEVFSDLVMFDMRSVGGEEGERTAESICEEWERNLAGIDQVHHAAGNHIVHFVDNTAQVTCYATAIHYKASATKGHTREFIGSYDIHLMKTSMGWRVYEFRFKLKFMTGNIELA